MLIAKNHIYCFVLSWITALHKEDVAPTEVDTVVGTHGHSDHIGNLNLFPQATIIVSYDICRGDTYINNQLCQVCLPPSVSTSVSKTMHIYLGNPKYRPVRIRQFIIQFQIIAHTHMRSWIRPALI